MKNLFYGFTQLPLQDRLEILLTSKKKKVVFLYEEPDYGTYRYRVYNMCQMLAKDNDHIGVYFFSHELDKLLDLFEYIDLIIFSRLPWSSYVDQIVQLCKKNRIPTVFDVDDLVFNPEDIPQLTNYLSAKPGDFDFWFSYVAKRYLTAKYADYYLSTNKMLSNYLSALFGKPAFVVPNFLNSEQIDVSTEVYNNKKDYMDPDYFTIGYFSGTGTHNNDFSIVASDLYYLLSKYPNIILKVVGYLDIPHKLETFLSKGKIEKVGLLPYLDLQKCVGSCDLNIVPLVINKFTHCKSELKYFESAVVGTPTIASPTYVYSGAIHNGINGMIALSGEWRDSIEMLYNDRRYYRKLQVNAFNSALKHYSGDRIEKQIISFLSAVLP